MEKRSTRISHSTCPRHPGTSTPSDHLKHQTNWKQDPNYTKKWYDRGAKTFQANKYRKGACENCGPMTHDVKGCMERPRKLAAKHTNKHIAPDDKLEQFELNFEGKRDRWNGYDAAAYSRVIDSYEVRDEARQKYKKEQQLKKLTEKSAATEGEEGEDEGLGEMIGEDEAKVDESEQMDFAKVEKRVRTTGGGSTGTVRNLRIREDTAKYLLNLDINSAYYDPKTRSMREDHNPGSDANDRFYMGDNQNRLNGQASEHRQLNVHAWEAFEKGQDVHLQAAPSQAELLHRNFKLKEESLKKKVKDSIRECYGSASSTEKLPGELLLGQTESIVEYDRAGRVVKGQDKAVARSKYEEDVYINNHTTVWGSWWKDGQWGFRCCRGVAHLGYCTGHAGIDAAEASPDLLRSNIERKEAIGGTCPTTGLGPFQMSSEAKSVNEEKNPASWGTDTPDDLVLDKKKLKEALKKEEVRSNEETDERKRKYNVISSDEVTAEEMEAYRLKKSHFDDPMKGYLDSNNVV
eukprot:SM000232S07921  [mRNA]  locus=s232:4658:8755:- [translate_table: standard]